MDSVSTETNQTVPFLVSTEFALRTLQLRLAINLGTLPKYGSFNDDTKIFVPSTKGSFDDVSAFMPLILKRKKIYRIEYIYGGSADVVVYGKDVAVKRIPHLIPPVCSGKTMNVITTAQRDVFFTVTFARKLLFTGKCPHLVIPVLSYYHSNVKMYNMPEESKDKELYDNLVGSSCMELNENERRVNLQIPRRSNVMVMEYIDTTLHAVIKAHQTLQTKIQFRTFKSIMFQVIYSMYCMQQIIPTFVHGDLHFRNILVRKVLPGVTHTYMLTSTQQKFYVNLYGYMCIISDFGVSSYGKLRSHNVCRSHYYDISMFLNSMLLSWRDLASKGLLHISKEEDTDTKHFINWVLHPSFQTRGKGKKFLNRYQGVNIKYDVTNRVWCNFKNEPLPHIPHRELKDMLHHEFFGEYKVLPRTFLNDEWTI
jgi:hypothetical protein